MRTHISSINSMISCHDNDNSLTVIVPNGNREKLDGSNDRISLI